MIPVTRHASRSGLAALALTIALGPPALAHALLRAATPAPGSTVATAPTELALTFSETVEPALCRVAVTSAKGVAETAGRPQADPQDGKRLLVTLRPLAPGAYTVRWQAVSTDTHKTQGRFTFTVKP